MRTSRMIILLAALLLLVAGSIQAQDSQPISYYVAADANGVQQVYQMLLGNEGEPRQLTLSGADIITFGVAHDGLSIAYISGGQLWLQPIHTEEAIALAPVSATQFFSSPVYSPDGQYIAYADSGVWLLDLGTRESRQILADVPLAEMASNAKEYRIFQPEYFVPGADGTAAQLVVDIGIWEWNTAGIYDLASGELQELEGQLHTGLLPLSNGEVLLYGNSGVAGEFALHLAENANDINTYTQVVNFADLTDSTLFAEQAVEIAPGVVRVFGSTLSGPPLAFPGFYFDYDVAAGKAGEVNFITLPESSEGSTLAGMLSPDGSLVPIYEDALWTDAGSIYGKLALHDLTANAELAQLPQSTGVFRWQP